MIKEADTMESIIKRYIEKKVVQINKPIGATLSSFKILSNDFTQDFGVGTHEVIFEYRTCPSHFNDPRRELIKVRAGSGEVIGFREI